jgi:hypothetical protein
LGEPPQLQFPKDVVLQLSIRVDLRDPWKKLFSTDFTDSADLQQQRQRLWGERQQPNSSVTVVVVVSPERIRVNQAVIRENPC